METELRELTFYRGVSVEPFTQSKNTLFVEDIIREVFKKQYPHLLSPVASRYNIEQAEHRFKTMEKEQLEDLMDEHYAGDRQYSLFVSATENEEEAAFFAGSALSKKHPWGMIVRFTHGGPRVRYSPRFATGNYEEILVVGGVRPENIDKITLIESTAENPYFIHYIFRRLDDDSIEKFRSPNPERFDALKNLRWSPETFFKRT